MQSTNSCSPNPLNTHRRANKKVGRAGKTFFTFFHCPMNSWWDLPNIWDHKLIRTAASHLFFSPKKVPKKNQQGGHPGDMFFYHQMLYSSGSRLVVYGEETIEIRPWSRFMWTCWMDGPGRFWRQQVRYIDWLLKRFQGNIAVCVALVFWDIINLANGPKARS